MAFCLTAAAKINLYLEVVGLRLDGYHDIATVFLPLLEPTDRLTLTPAPDGMLTVHCDCPDVPPGPGNLCWRAATAFAEAAGLEAAWQVELEKRIPIAAGLGGGSSDAAAVLRLLMQLYPGALSVARLAQVAAALGADVPFFLEPRPALGQGMGERLSPIPCALGLDVVLANPRFPVSAAWAYGNRTRVPSPPAPPLAELLAALAAGDLEGVARLTYNALEYAVLDKFPLLPLLQEALLAAGCLCAHVSGSGPTLYGLCRTGAAPAIVARLRDDFGPALWLCATASTAVDRAGE